jgi:chloroplast NAD(P)H dehydrogenase
MCGGHGQGCIVAPSLSIGAVLLQQAAAAAAFQYNHVEIIESQQGLSVSGPWTCLSAMVMASSDYQQAMQLASSLSGLGQIYNDGDASKGFPVG